MIAIVFSLLTISCAVIPIVPNLWLLYVCAFVSGFGSSVTVCGYTVWLIEMWSDKSGPLLQINEFGFGIGSILATVILKPFLVGEIGTDSDIESKTTIFSNIILNLGNEKSSDVDRRSRLMWPSLITGISILPSE